WIQVADFIIRVQIISIIGIRQIIWEVLKHRLYETVRIQPGLITLFCILWQETFFLYDLTDLRKQILSGLLIIHMCEPAIVIQTKVYRVQIFPGASKQTAR